MLSFSCCKDNLKGIRRPVKIETTRKYTKHRWDELNRAMTSHPRDAFCWWKPRTKEKESLFACPILKLQTVAFLPLSMEDPRPWPYEIKVGLSPEGKPFVDEVLHFFDIGEAETYMLNEGFTTMEDFISTLSGKNPEGIAEPMIRIRFKNPNANWRDA